MVKATCSICGYSLDKEQITLCPDCQGQLCDECSYIYRGHCQDCYQEVTLDFEE